MGNGNSEPKVPLNWTWTLLVAGVTVAVSVLTSGFAARDAVLKQAQESVEATKRDVIQRYTTDLSHYVTLEQFLEYRREERARQDSQYYAILAAVSRLEAKLRR